MLKVTFYANICDEGTMPVSKFLRQPLGEFAEGLRGEYGGPMEELWIDIELIPSGPKRAFRFQRRVSGQSPPFGLPAIPDSHNVGHFSVQPDFVRIREAPSRRTVSYVLSLVLASLETLRGKRSIRGFDLDAFVTAFRSTAARLEFPIEDT